MSAFLGLVEVDRVEVDTIGKEDCGAILRLKFKKSSKLKRWWLGRESSSSKLLSPRFTWPAMKWY
jgi:hypothetical protein